MAVVVDVCLGHALCSQLLAPAGARASDSSVLALGPVTAYPVIQSCKYHLLPATSLISQGLKELHLSPLKP